MNENFDANLRQSYPEKGLYIVLKDGVKILINEERTQEAFSSFSNKQGHLYNALCEEFSFLRCGGCPTQDGSICDGLKPVFLVMNKLGDKKSYEPVTAIYHGADEFLIKETTLQHALESLFKLMVTDYCHLSKIFNKDYQGIRPLMDAREVAEKIFFNIITHYHHDMPTSRQHAKELEAVIDLTSQSRSLRIQKLTHGDALLNANANMGLSPHFLTEYLGGEQVTEEDSSWNPIYDTKILEIDLDHQRIDGLLNTLRDTYKKENGPLPAELLIKIITITEEHFKLEETILENEFNLPFPQGHQDAHREFLKKLNQFRDANKSLTIDTLEVFRLWLLEHILVYDKALGILAGKLPATFEIQSLQS